MKKLLLLMLIVSTLLTAVGCERTSAVLAEKDKIIADLETKLQEKTTELSRLESNVAELKKTAEDKKNNIEDFESKYEGISIATMFTIDVVDKWDFSNRSHIDEDSLTLVVIALNGDNSKYDVKFTVEDEAGEAVYTGTAENTIGYGYVRDCWLEPYEFEPGHYSVRFYLKKAGSDEEYTCIAERPYEFYE